MIADGSVQFNLHSSHAELGEAAELTQDLAGLWSVVSAVLFTALESYERVVQPIDVEVERDVATVWTETQTVTLERGSDAPSVLDFTEVYLLLRLDDQWRIAATANNRPATDP